MGKMEKGGRERENLRSPQDPVPVFGRVLLFKYEMLGSKSSLDDDDDY